MTTQEKQALKVEGEPIPEAVKKYWREAQQKHRSKLKAEKNAGAGT